VIFEGNNLIFADVFYPFSYLKIRQIARLFVCEKGKWRWFDGGEIKAAASF